MTPYDKTKHPMRLRIRKLEKLRKHPAAAVAPISCPMGGPYATPSPGDPDAGPGQGPHGRGDLQICGSGQCRPTASRSDECSRACPGASGSVCSCHVPDSWRQPMGILCAVYFLPLAHGLLAASGDSQAQGACGYGPRGADLFSAAEHHQDEGTTVSKKVQSSA